jgi:enoyl-CoA hydratase/carnithine racemase
MFQWVDCPRLVGRSRAELCATGRAVDRVVPAADLLAKTEKLARTFAAASTVALGVIKRALEASERNDCALSSRRKPRWSASSRTKRKHASPHSRESRQSIQRNARSVQGKIPSVERITQSVKRITRSVKRNTREC